MNASWQGEVSLDQGILQPSGPGHLGRAVPWNGILLGCRDSRAVLIIRLLKRTRVALLSLGVN